MPLAKRTFKWRCLDCGNYGFTTEYEDSPAHIPSKCPNCGSRNIQVEEVLEWRS